MTDHDRPDLGPASADGRPSPTPPPPPLAVTPAPSRAGGKPVRGSVATVGALALLAVLAVIVWGGGDRSTGAPTGPGGGGTPVASNEGFGGGQSGPVATEEPQVGSTSSSEASPTPVAAPLEPAQIAPSALLVDAPEIAGAAYEWRIPGRVDSVSRRFLDVFPQPGYEMSGGLGADHPSGQTIYVYTVSPLDDVTAGPAGTMYFMADPADPQGATRVALKIGR